MDKIVYISFATENSPYVDVLNKGLLPSLQKFELTYDFEITENRKNWCLNTQLKASVCYKMLIKHQCPIVFLDADAVVVQEPVIFSTLSDKCDISFHNLDSKLFWHNIRGEQREPLTGTVYFNYSLKVLDFISKWIAQTDINKKLHDMDNFKIALGMVPDLKIYPLPIEYVSIVKRDNRVPSSIPNPIIVHYQASRRYRHYK